MRAFVEGLISVSLLSLLASACTVAPLASERGCATRTDCAGGEVCESGQCVESRGTGSTPDAGFTRQPPTDSGQGFSVDDAGNVIRDTTLVDAGVMTPADTGVVVPPDDPNQACPGKPHVIVGSKEYCTISQAIGDAPSGAVVQIQNGIWNEAVSIEKPIRLVGGGSQTTLINTTALSAITINATDVTIENLVVDANRQEGISVTGQVTLVGIKVTAAVGAGIRVSSGRADISQSNIVGVDCKGGCTQQNWGEGIVFHANTTGTVIDTTIESPTFIGIYTDAANVDISRTTITSAGRKHCTGGDLTRCFPGILVGAGSRVNITDNTIIRFSGGAGVEVFDSQFTMFNSTSTGNTGNGITIVDSFVQIEGNRVDNNASTGLSCTNASVSGCINNTHSNNTGGWVNAGQCNDSC